MDVRIFFTTQIQSTSTKKETQQEPLFHFLAGATGLGHEYFLHRRARNFSTPARGFAYSRNIAPLSSSLLE